MAVTCSGAPWMFSGLGRRPWAADFRRHRVAGVREALDTLVAGLEAAEAAGL